MFLRQVFLTENACYKQGTKHIPKGIIVHTTGANNPYIKRYVQPNDGFIGENEYNNSWNQHKPGGRFICVHAFIGKTQYGNNNVATYQTLPWDMVGWHAGGDANYRGYLGFEICEDDLKDADYFRKVYKEAVELTAYLCKLYNIPVNSECVIGHYEAYALGLASNHGDPRHWFSKFGKSMDTFREDVKGVLGDSAYIDSITVDASQTTSPVPYESTDMSSAPVDSMISVPSMSITRESKVLPRKVTDSGTQPFLPFVEITIAGRVLTFIPPQHIVSLEVDRIEGSTATFVLSIFDRKWEDVEILISSNFKDVNLRYGFVKGKSSPTYNLTITDYSIRFTTAGTIISMNGVSDSAIQNFTPITLNTNTINPTKAVKSICREMGWSILPANFEDTDDVPLSNQDSISLINEHPVTYIKNHLAPIAVRSSDGESGFQFYLDETITPPAAHFKVRKLLENAHKTYVYMKGLDTPILDLDISVNGVYGGIVYDGVTTGVEAVFIDPLTKKKVTLSEDIDSVRITTTGEYSHTSSKQLSTNIDAAGSSPAKMNAIVNYRLKTAMPYEGTMKLVGDPEFEIGNVVRLMIITDEGNLHHCSGLYYVLGVLDSISEGGMITTLSVIKGEDIERGIEVVNYKTLLK